MDEWEIAEQNTKAALTTLADLECSLPESYIYENFDFKRVRDELATYATKQRKKRSKRAKE